MAQFTDEHKQERSTDYFTLGVHKVLIEGIKFDMTEDGKEFAEFTVLDPNDPDRTGTARLWFTTDAALGFSFNIIKGIFVHNTPEKDKDKIRKALDGVSDTKELEKLCEKLKGKECWYAVYEDAKRTYTAKDGTQKPSINRNVYGYEPKNIPAPQKSDAQKVAEVTGGEEITTENLDDAFPFK